MLIPNAIATTFKTVRVTRSRLRMGGRTGRFGGRVPGTVQHREEPLPEEYHSPGDV